MARDWSWSSLITVRIPAMVMFDGYKILKVKRIRWRGLGMNLHQIERGRVEVIRQELKISGKELKDLVRED